MRDQILSKLWAKTGKESEGGWHPLILHMMDVAAASDVILEREPQKTRDRMALVLGLEWENARPWLLIVIACHDLGKACPGFQCKWKNMTGMDSGRSPNTDVKHGFVSQIALAELLLAHGWPEDLAELAADAVGCHHGERISPVKRRDLEGDRRALGKQEWDEARKCLVQSLITLFNPGKTPTKQTLNGPDFMLLAGLTGFADWIGSNETWFSYGTSEDCSDMRGWFHKRRIQAELALDRIGWDHRTPLASLPQDFAQVFNLSPRPLQQAISDLLPLVTEPSILLAEAPMGEGKTEAAFFAHLELQRRFGHRGLYVALPTKATGNAMFRRTLKFLTNQRSSRTVDLQLLHGAALLNDSFQNLRLAGIHAPETGGEIRAAEWFTHKKRALLSEYGVGTVDQAILPILPVRHNFVRLWGLANRVVIFDEIHAYDAYTGTLLVQLLRWLLALGSSVVLLSATLPLSIRRKLAQVTCCNMPEQEAAYPRLCLFQSGEVKQIHFEADPARRRSVRLVGIQPDPASMRAAVEDRLVNGGMGLILVNTVQRAQDLFQLFPPGTPIEKERKSVGKRLADGTEIFLFHARFPADRRQQREDHALETFGPGANRSGRKILIATQVVEQSLDLDFDVIATDLAPIDLILQRAGRLWRHDLAFRPIREPALMIAGLSGESPPFFDKPLWWGAVYREDLLLRTWIFLHEKRMLILPDDIDAWVQAVYEDNVAIPDNLRERLERASQKGEGDVYARQLLANQAIIGLPEDASWNDAARLVLYDEDEPGVHRTLTALTRLEEEDSVIAVPLWPQERFNAEEVPTFHQAKTWFMRSMSLSRKIVVQRLRAIGVPEGWRKSPLLRNCFPLMLDDRGCWTENAVVRLDDDLGLVYETKEVE